jgi:hypothetical protein
VNRRVRAVSRRCADASCGEYGYFTDGSDAPATWRCTRHTSPDEVMVLVGQTRISTLVATRLFSDGRSPVSLGLFWIPEGATTGSGFTHGPGFKAYANDFPEGTRIVVTAQVLAPVARGAAKEGA